MKAALRPFSKTFLKRLVKVPSIAVAVSGGGDSMALLLMVRTALAHNQVLTALTVDHALRKNSAAEARKVKTWCKARGITHVTLKWNHEGVNSGIQAKARQARYDLMTQWCHKHGLPVLLTAHTKEDQAETVAMRSLRTDSAKSLAAIWPETEINGLKVWRPLLAYRRTDLRNYLFEQKQDWIEDPSNSDPRFERVRLRQAGISNLLAARATIAQLKVKSAAAQAAKWFINHIKRDASSMVEFDPISFKELNIDAQDASIIRLIETVGGKPPERAKRLALLQWLAKPNTPRRSLGGAIFVVRKAAIIIGREPARITEGPINLTLKPLLWDNRFLATGPKGSTIASKASFNSMERIENLPAFVDQGLPVIMFHREVMATPFFSHHPQAKLTLVEK